MRTPAFRMAFSQSLDAATFGLCFLLIPGLVVEQNPLIAGPYRFGGILAVLGFKIGIATMIAYLATHVTITKPRLVTILLAAGAASGIIGAASNLAALIGAA